MRECRGTIVWDEFPQYIIIDKHTKLIINKYK